MVAGDSDRDESRVARAVDAAEDFTGLQLCVYLGRQEGPSARAHAEGLLVAAGARSRPAVMLYVAADTRRVEVVTADWVRERISDAAASAAVEAMVGAFRRGDLARGLESGIAAIAAAAGPRRGDEPTSEELPDVLS